MTEQEKIKRLAEWVNFWGGVTQDWNPFTSLDNARQLEDEVERRGLKDRYGMSLTYLLFAKDAHYSTFDVAHASPAQRAEAVLRLMEGEGK